MMLFWSTVALGYRPPGQTLSPVASGRAAVDGDSACRIAPQLIGWVPFLAGAGLSVCALLFGAGFAGWDAPVRPAGAVAAAMRNPGLALLIATVNNLPVGVIASIFGYALGLALVVTAFVVLQGCRHAAAP